MKPPRKKGSRLNPLGLQSDKSRTLPRSGASIVNAKSSNSKKRRFNFTWKKFFISLGFMAGFFFLLLTGLFAYYVRELPNPKKIQSRQIEQSTQIYDRNGKNLYNIHGDVNRTIVTSDQISEYLKNAAISVEDSNFYKHHGFSIRGVLRATRDQITHTGLGGGGSTITQQYIKNALPEVGSEYSISRKIKELILAIEVEQIYSKSEILTGYLNAIPYGGSAYGIETASQVYFGKSAKDLTLSESATLAAIPQNPTVLSPYGNNVDKLFIRKNYILDRMVEEKYISEEQAKEAKTAAPSEGNISFKRQDDLLAPHFVFYVREKLINILDNDPQIAEKKLDQGGYKVTTSLDLETQQLAQKIVGEMGPDSVKKYNATNASLSAVDPKTGEILAMVGSIDYLKSKSGNTNFANADLQPGSSFKPIVFATAFGPKYKYSPGSITYDVPTDFGNYKPNNYNGRFNGAVTNRIALAQSLNIPAVKNLALVGVNDAVETARGLGISTLDTKKNDYGLSLVLGSGDVKPIEMAGAYGGFANGGMQNPLRPILKIEKDNQVIQDFTQTEAKKVLEPEVAYQISSILSDNAARTPVFGAKNNLTLGDRPVAAKSGTTENNRDGWVIGYTPSISVAVWVGNNDANKTMTKGADGSVVAGPVWNRFMREYLTGKPVEQFSRPSTIKDLAIDKLSGKLPTEQSPDNERIADIFAPWQEPKTFDNIHIKVRIVKGTNKLATELTPPDLVEERIYFTIRSEMPDNPAWEGPVQAWARSVYGDRVGSPPTEKDDIHTEENKPSITFISPTNNGTLSGTTTIQANPTGNRATTRVDYSIDGQVIGTATSAPWSISYNSSSLESGSHIIIATVTNDIGFSASSQITVTTTSDKTAPDSVKNTSAVSGKVGVKGIKLSWDNPNTSDLTKVIIYRSSTSGSLGTALKTEPATPGTSGTTDITLPSGTYYFTVRSVDASGNENTTNSNQTQSSASMLP